MKEQSHSCSLDSMGLVREFSQAPPINGPYAVGTRFVYLEPTPRPRLHTIDFVPYADWKGSATWSWHGQKVIVAPI
jgi:hypothetical protein